MNVFRNMFEMTKKRIKQTPLTSAFLVWGLVLSMLMISMGTSFVTEHLYAENEKENAKPPNGQQYDMVWSGNKTFENMEDCFQGIRNETGVIINGLMVHIDGTEINTYASVSAEWFVRNNGWHYPISEGKYFTKEQIQTGEKVVLIGKTYKEYTYKENNKTYINIEKEKYQVLGVVGTSEQISLWDSRIFMPCTSLPEKMIKEMSEYHDMTFILYNEKGKLAKDEKVIQKNAGKIFDEPKVILQGKIESGNMAEDLMNNPDMIYTIAIVGYLVSLIYAINIVAFWMEKRKYEIGIRKALGYKNRDISKIILSEMLGFSIISCLMAIAIQFIGSTIFGTISSYTLHIYLPNIVIGIVVVFLTTFITSVWPIIKALKVQPIEILRKG